MSQRVHFASDGPDFKELLSDAEKLNQALSADPTLLSKKNENDHTILHYLAAGLPDISEEATRILLAAMKKEDLEVTTRKGDTPIHVLLMNCTRRNVYFNLCPLILKRAVELNFDFSLSGDRGYKPLHLAILYSFEGREGMRNTRRENNLARFLEIVPTVNLNALSNSGASAFFYAVSNSHFAEAYLLLDKGADPKLFGDASRDPMQLLKGKSLLPHAGLAMKIAQLEKQKQDSNVAAEAVSIVTTVPAAQASSSPTTKSSPVAIPELNKPYSGDFSRHARTLGLHKPAAKPAAKPASLGTEESVFKFSP